jgi:serine/threonine protein kinase
MQTDDRIFPLLDRWVAEADAGRLLSVAELCRDCADLLPQVDQEIAVLRRFHVLARPSASTPLEQPATVERTLDESGRDASPGPLPAPGGNFGRYQIIAELGQGGMGIVYQVRDTQLGRDVALKVMRPDVAANPISSARFLREARALAAIRHDHVVEIYDYGEVDGARFVTMPLLAGESLQTRLDRQSPLPPAEVIRIGTELAQGLAAVHARKLIHRDLKPSNVWLEAPTGRVKLLDFGLARDSRASDRLTSPGGVVGTPVYMSPEQVNGLELDARTDLFSLGSILYKAATGQSAFAARSLTATLKAVGETDPPPARRVNPAVPTGLSNLIESLHRKDPADRPASAAEVVKVVRTLATAPAALTPLLRDRRTDDGVGKWWPIRALLVVASVLALFLVLGMIILPLIIDLFGEANPRPDQPAERNKLTEPLRVRALEALHFKTIDNKRTQARLVLGTHSFGASVDDDIKVTAQLSRPAYSYIIVFRPDGKDQVLYPQHADDVPELTDQPTYPSKDRSKVYGLTEGTGLWVIALVASNSPLPAYTAWRRQHQGGPWARSDGEANVVWLDDGQWLEAVTPRGIRTRAERGEREAPGSAPVLRLVDWLKAETGGVVWAVGFTVEAKK